MIKKLLTQYLMRKNEVHVFLAKATSLNAENYPAGERHALHIYLRQPLNTDHDYRSAELVTLNSGWVDINLVEAKTLSRTIEKKQETLHSCYMTAYKYGSAILVYGEIEKNY
jgi:hypothetical protein